MKHSLVEISLVGSVILSLLVGGAIFLGISHSEQIRQLIPEEDLIIREGLPEDVNITEQKGVRKILSFRVAEFKTEYCSDSSRQPRYSDVVRAVTCGEPIRI